MERFVGLIKRLVEPHPRLEGAAERERARQLSALLLGLVAFASLTTIPQLLFVPGFFPGTFLGVLGAIGLLGVAYVVSRTARPTPAAVVAVAVPLVATLAIGLLNPDDRVWWAFATLSPLLATMFFSTRTAALVAALTATGVLGVVVLSRAQLTQVAAVGPVAFHFTFAPLLIIAAAHRHRVESQRHAELAARDAALAESRRMESVGRLAGGLAHDFNNLLTVIVANAELLQAHGQRRAGEIIDAAGRAGALIRQLLAFARRQPTSPQPVDLGHVVAGLEPMLRRLLGEAVTLHTSHGGGPAVVLADPTQLEQVVMNLVANARDAMPNGGAVLIDVGHASGQVVLTVRDTGIGMDEATRSRIFEPYFTTRADSGGTGLGLPTVCAIVEQAGGRLEVSSHVGRGSEFRVVLPAATASPAVLVDQRPPTAPRSALRVLLVDDELHVLSSLGQGLAAHGLTVAMARSADEAIRLAKAGELDVLITDVVLPDMGGPEIAAAVRQLRPGLPVVFLSGYGEETAGLEGRDACVVAKPLTARELADRVNRLLDGGRAAALH